MPGWEWEGLMGGVHVFLSFLFVAQKGAQITEVISLIAAKSTSKHTICRQFHGPLSMFRWQYLTHRQCWKDKKCHRDELSAEITNPKQAPVAFVTRIHTVEWPAENGKTLQPVTSKTSFFLKEWENAQPYQLLTAKCIQLYKGQIVIFFQKKIANHRAENHWKSDWAAHPAAVLCPAGNDVQVSIQVSVGLQLSRV